MFLALAAPSAAFPAAGHLYGLSLEHNSPAMPGLVEMDVVTGAVTRVGAPHRAMAGTGDLGVIDQRRRVFYYLGDTSEGTTLAGVSLADGSEVCNCSVPLREVGFVGLGQSLDIDDANDRLVISGIHATANGSAVHSVLQSPLPGCGPFTLIGSFGVAAEIPMLHGSALDSAGQRLFLTLSPTKNGVSLGVVDLANKDMVTLTPEGGPDELLGMSWDPLKRDIVGLSQSPGAPGIYVVRFDPVSETFTQTLVKSADPILAGNGGSVHAFDADGRVMYSVTAPKPGVDAVDLVQINVDTSELVRQPAVVFPATDPFKLLDNLQWRKG
jgi:hypothetical protein